MPLERHAVNQGAGGMHELLSKVVDRPSCRPDFHLLLSTGKEWTMQIKKTEIRERIRDMVSILHELDDRLTELAESLPLPLDAEDMWESRLPTNFNTNLFSALEAVRSDCVQDAVATLMCAARQSEDSLRRRWLLARNQENGQGQRPRGDL
jgi:hypothetical protein